MEAFLLALANILPGPLRVIARPVVDRLIRVWRWSESLARRVREGFRRAVTGATRLRDGIVRLGRETLDTIRWVITVRIPQLLRSTRDAILRTLTDAINRARNGLTAVIDTLRRWATTAVNGLRSLVDTVRRWAAEILARLQLGLNRLLDRVFGLWSTPTRLAAWLAAAMWTALWRYAESNLERYAEALWRRRQAVFLRTIGAMERLIGRIL